MNYKVLTLALLFATLTKAETTQLLETELISGSNDEFVPISAAISESIEILTPAAGTVPKDKTIKDALDNWIKYAARTNMQRELQKEARVTVYKSFKDEYATDLRTVMGLVRETNQQTLDIYFNYYTKLQDKLENEGVSARFQLVEDVLGICIKGFGDNIKTISETKINQAFARWPEYIDDEANKEIIDSTISNLCN